MAKICPRCGAYLVYYKGSASWFCSTEKCETFTRHFDRYGNLVKETLAGFSLRNLHGSKRHDIIGEISK